jgi:hypothetical protein
MSTFQLMCVFHLHVFSTKAVALLDLYTLDIKACLSTARISLKIYIIGKQRDKERHTHTEKKKKK